MRRCRPRCKRNNIAAGPLAKTAGFAERAAPRDLQSRATIMSPPATIKKSQSALPGRLNRLVMAGQQLKKPGFFELLFERL